MRSQDQLTDVLSVIRATVFRLARTSIGIHSYEDLVQNAVLWFLESPPNQPERALPYARTLASRAVYRAIRRAVIERNAMHTISREERTDGDPAESVAECLEHLRSLLTESQQIVLDLLLDGQNDIGFIASAACLPARSVRQTARRIRNHLAPTRKRTRRKGT